MSDVQVVEIPARYTLTVVLPGPPPNAIAIEGRVAKLIAWLVQNRARVERVGAGALVFNMSLNRFQPEIRDIFPPTLVVPENPDETNPLPATG